MRLKGSICFRGSFFSLSCSLFLLMIYSIRSRCCPCCPGPLIEAMIYRPHRKRSLETGMITQRLLCKDPAAVMCLRAWKTSGKQQLVVAESYNAAHCFHTSNNAHLVAALTLFPCATRTEPKLLFHRRL